MKKIEEKYYKIWITLIKGIGIKRYINLIKKFKTIKNIFSASGKDLENIQLIDEKLIQNILNPQNKILAKKHLVYMEKNNIDIIELRPTFIENSIIDLKAKFHLFNDVYKTDDFILSSSDDETVFYLRNISNHKLTSIDYRTIINVLRDYYADLWGLDLNCGDYSIIYLFTLDHKFCKILIEPNMHLKVEKNENDKSLKLIN